MGCLLRLVPSRLPGPNVVAIRSSLRTNTGSQLCSVRFISQTCYWNFDEVAVAHVFSAVGEGTSHCLSHEVIAIGRVSIELIDLEPLKDIEHLDQNCTAGRWWRH